MKYNLLNCIIGVGVISVGEDKLPSNGSPGCG